MLLALSGCGMGVYGFFCAIPRDPQVCEFGDRCHIEDGTFIIADQLYARLGSLDLVERHLCEVQQLRRCEVNEALYRLKKVHGLP